MKRIAIIGGGISGLSAAFYLEERRKSGVPVEYALYESSSRLGGVLLTERMDDCLVEAGPDSFLSEKPWAADLCRKVGLGDQLIGSNDSARKTYILLNRRLVPLPDGLMFMVPTNLAATAASPLFSARAKLRIAREWFFPPGSHEGDESVSEFVERHYGEEMVERLADPLLAGVYGGEAKNLSVRAVLPRFAEMEKNFGSLGRGMVASRKRTESAATPRPIFTSLRDGMQSLTDTIAARLNPDSVRINSAVQAIQPEGESWIVSAGFDSDGFDAVVLATPTAVARKLLATSAPNIAEDISQISYNSSITVALIYPHEVRKALPPGFGFLVPRREGLMMLATTFVHNKFPHRAPDNRALLRCFLGGSQGEAAINLPDERILGIVRAELTQILNISVEPIATCVFRWNAAMAQYNVGHLDRLQHIDEMLNDLPGLALAGNGYRGIGVPDCVRSGQQAAEKVLTSLGLPPSS